LVQTFTKGIVSPRSEISTSMAEAEIATCNAKAEDEESATARRQKIAKAIMFSNFLSTCQHVALIQSEPMLMNMLYNGDVGKSARALANSMGAVGVSALIFNQFGGKLTDAIGRKPGLLVGPLGNILLGALVFLKPTSPLRVIVCRIIRMVITTFSNTVVSAAAYADILKGKELAANGAKVGAVTGIAIVCAPFIEAQILLRLKHPKYCFLLISLLAVAQSFTSIFMVPETLTKEKRISVASALSMNAINPFGFVKIYTEGSKSLQKLVNMTSLQFFAEGKNISDYGMLWWVNNLKWSTVSIRNFVMGYGLSCMLGGMFLIPKLVMSMPPRRFTSFTNATVSINYLWKGIAGPSTAAYIVASFIGLPGVNAASGTVLKAIAANKAVQEGFGNGEFSAWTNNLRAVVSSVAPMLYGNLYASCKDSFPSASFAACGFIAGVLPEYLLWCTTDAELQVAKA